MKREAIMQRYVRTDDERYPYGALKLAAPHVAHFKTRLFHTSNG